MDIMCKFENRDLRELLAAARHLEDLEVFAGQRSRLNPEPGWELVLAILRRELPAVVVELRQMGVTKKFGTLGPEGE